METSGASSLFILSLSMVLLAGLPAAGATLEVGPGKPYAAIQAAIDAASQGDSVLVRPGTYYENINFGGKNLVLTSAAPTDPAVVAATIIDGGQNDSVVRFSGTETAACVLRGFTIQNGSASEYNWYRRGGGIQGNATHASIQFCVIQNNLCSSEGLGGGIDDCDGMIADCRILDNISNARRYFDGIWLGDGGGLAHCDGLIVNCIIAGNRTDPGPSHEGYGGRGGGFYECNGTIINCTIYGNHAIAGGAAYSCNGQLVNCIIQANSSSGYGDFLYDCSSPAYCCIQSGAGGGAGNIVCDPLFAGPDQGDFHLRSAFGRWDPSLREWVYDSVTSPCIDAGNQWDEGSAPDGLNDWREELWPHGKRINLGAYGGTPEASMSANLVGLVSDLDHDGGTELSDLALLCEDWLLSEPLLDTDLDSDNDVDMADFSILSGQWGQTAPAVLLISDPELTFRAYEDGVAPDPNVFTIVNSGDQPCDWSADLADKPAWLSVSPASGTLAAGESEPVTLAVDITGLAAGTYNYSFQVSALGAANNPQTMSVRLAVEHAEPVGYWQLDETAGLATFDSSGSGHDGTLANMDSNDWVGGRLGGATAGR